MGYDSLGDILEILILFQDESLQLASDLYD